LAQHVDESGRNHLAVRIDGLFAGCVMQIADGGDAAGANAEVGRVPRLTAAVDNAAIHDNHVERVLRVSRRPGLRRRRTGRHQHNKYRNTQEFASITHVRASYHGGAQWFHGLRKDTSRREAGDLSPA
jgi:hypothetical protein